MKQVFTISKATALLCAAGSLCLVSLPSQAADSGTLTLNAKFIKTTCTLAIGKSGSNNKPNTQTLTLGTVASNNLAGVQGAGTNFGNKSLVSFELLDPADSTKPCDLSAYKSWKITTQLTAADIATAGGVTHLKNKKTDADATDALVTLFGSGPGANPWTGPLNLTAGAPITIASLATTGITQKVHLHAQFAYPNFAADATNTQAKSGLFQFTLPVTVAYE